MRDCDQYMCCFFVMRMMFYTGVVIDVEKFHASNYITGITHHTYQKHTVLFIHGGLMCNCITTTSGCTQCHFK